MSASITARAFDHVQQVASWAARRGHLPAAYQAATVARYLRDRPTPLVAAYMFVLDARELEPVLDAHARRALATACRASRRHG